MTNEDIINIAHDAGMTPISHVSTADVICSRASLERFAALVAAAEREACAALCDKISDDDGFEGGYADNCAKAIRARGQG
jgi:hypothetical protein